jgi:tRNA(Ile)-lysidine synthase
MTAGATRAAAPLGDAEFASLLNAAAPFEHRPVIAVGVSGGADSLALALLTNRWARARGGAVVALTVDHGLRADSAAEAARVGEWLAAHQVPHRVLQWLGPKPTTGIQDAARAARRDLLFAHCRAERILHLLLGHQRDDQAETVLLRLAAGSGGDGLAAMSQIVETPDLRIVRPLLDVPHARLIATLGALDQAWVEDPSNRDQRFGRSAARRALGDTADVSATVRSFAGERVEREGEVAALLARVAAIYPEGCARLDGPALSAAVPEIGCRALARVLMTVGGAVYAPRQERLDRLYQMIRGGTLAAGRTLAGCRVIARRSHLLVVREPEAAAAPVPVAATGVYSWDGRFVVAIAGAAVPPGTSVQALGMSGWAEVAAARKSLRNLPIPAVVRPVLPALCDLEGVREVPHLLYRRQGIDPDSVRVISAVFRPSHALAGAGFTASSPPV